MGNGERCEDNIRLDLFNIDGEGNDLNDTAENNGDTDSLNLQELFADMPSVHDTTRAMHSMSRRSLRRRRSTRSGRGIRGGDTIDRVQSANENEVFDPEEIADILEETDGVASSKMLKSMAAPMRQRKSVRHIQANRKQSVRYQQKRLSWWKYGKLKIAMGWAQFKTKIKDTLSELELWRSPLKEVEGKFGNGVLSYFLFLKSLLFLNILIFLVEFCFVVIPQIFINYNHLLPDPHAFKVLQSRSNCTAEDKSFYENRSPSDHVLDFFTGQGYINTTLMFYSNYHGQVVFDENKLAYDMPLAYMLVGGAYFIVSLLLMVKNLAQGFTESVIESGGFFYSYCNKVFAGWDYCIIKEEAVNLKRNCIYKDFEAELAEEKRLEEMKNRTSCDKFKLYTLRMIISLVVMVLLAGSIYAIIKSVEVSQNPELTQQNNSLETIVKRWASSLTISVLNVVLPFFFEILTSLEKWSPRVELAISLWRAVLLKLASVAVLVITLFTSYSDFDCKQQCWENQVASQMFNLILIDFFITAGITIVAETSRKYVAEYLSCGCGLGQKIGWQEFQIPKNVLDLVYGQSLIWIGTFFAPLIPVIGILKLILMFYIKKISLMYNCKPSSTPYQGARSNYFFTLLLLLTFLLCTVAVGWGLTRITTSCCGPFGNTLCDENKKMLDIVTARIEEWPHVISEILDFLRTSVFVFPLFIIIFLLLYYYHSMTKAHEKMISMLKDQLITEGRDKRFLMDRLVKASVEAKTPTNNAASSRAK